MRERVFILLLLTLGFCSLMAQDVNPNGYNIFYYSNGNISSEGNMVGGKPDGFWRSYYDDGTLKSEGNRLFFELDSIWNFYAPDGHIETSITYRNGLKNGYATNYNFYYTKDSSKVYYLSSKELYSMNSREGLSYFYDKNNKLKYTFNYKSNKRSGEGKEYDSDSTVITLYTYYNGYQIEAVKINRRDNNNLKQNKWIEFYPNGNKKIEANYWDDKLHGVYKEYNLAGRVILEKRYEKGELYVPKIEDEIELKAEIKKSFYPNGRIQYEGAFVNNTPVGIHKEYSESGTIITNKEYNDEGLLVGEGMFDENGNKTGKWRLFDPYENYYYAEGNYFNGQKEGKWVFFYLDGSIEQEGFFSKDLPDGEWIWFHRNGNKKVEEEYVLGNLEGFYNEYDTLGNIVAKGEYFDNAKIGEWFYNIGIITSQGQYDYDKRIGEWKYIYKENNKKRFIGSYKNGEPDGTHTWYYGDGNVEIIGDYRVGKKNKTWKKYNPDGSIYMSYTYRNGVLYKIDGVKILLEKEIRKK